MGGLNGHGDDKGGEEENMDSDGELNLRAILGVGWKPITVEGS